MAIAPASVRSNVQPLPLPTANTRDTATTPPAKKDTAATTPARQDTFSSGTQGAKGTASSSGTGAAQGTSPATAPASGSPGGRVTVFDEFQEGPSHGQFVDNVLQGNLSQPTGITNVSVPSVTVDGSLNDQIEGFAAGSLDYTSNAMQGVLDNPGNTKVINQSQALSPARMVQNMKDVVQMERAAGAASGKPSGLEQTIKKGLGLSEDTDLLGQKGLQSFMSHVEQVFQNSPKIAEAKQRYDAQSQKLEDAGIMHVVAAGNDRALLEDMGVNYGKDAMKSLYSNDQALTVGASTGGSKDKIASFSSANDQVDVAVDGTDIDVGGGRRLDGTSFSAPQVAATLSDMFGANPKLTNDQVRNMLTLSSRNTEAPDELEGAGILDMDMARKLASLSTLEVPSA